MNLDGRLDLVVEFHMRGLGLVPEDMLADLWGVTRRGVPFSGSDLVQVVP